MDTYIPLLGDSGNLSLYHHSLRLFVITEPEPSPCSSPTRLVVEANLVL
jgi:hypothetical protein